MLKKIALLFLLSIAAKEVPAAPGTGDIEVLLSGFRNETGVVLVNLFNRSSDYPGPEKAFRQITLDPKKRLKALFREIPFGDYSISVIHDENIDHKFTMRWFPWPKPLEGGGFSNNAEASFGPPDYAKTLFSHRVALTRQEINITYP